MCELSSQSPEIELDGMTMTEMSVSLESSGRKSDMTGMEMSVSSGSPDMREDGE